MGARILLVDDSRFILTALRKLFGESGDLTVAEAVSSGAAALAYLREHPVDAVVLDLNMPEMDGVETTRHIMERFPTPILLLTAAAENDPGVVAALQAGALDMMQKPGGDERSPFIRDGCEELFRKVRALARIRLAAPRTAAAAPPVTLPAKRFRLALIGISTGGPGALSRVLPRLTLDLALPVLIVQHIADGYTADLARNLQQKCRVPVREAEGFQPLLPGTVTIARSGSHLEVSPAGRLRLTQTGPVNGFMPSVDVLFTSAARNFPRAILGIIMTGMGDDGLRGCRELKRKGHYVVIQDEASSVVWGMPGEVHRAGCFDQELPLDGIGALLETL